MFECLNWIVIFDDFGKRVILCDCLWFEIVDFIRVWEVFDVDILRIYCGGRTVIFMILEWVRCDAWFIRVWGGLEMDFGYFVVYENR